ncbi:MAG: DUF2971 domain-containing protein [Roseivirga sp.]|jgi:hypothetical protein|uniref:DUF2971 domain-containing protein n=1 Tax=Roseivirga sp. TaxID=1964215 RepID=UPI001B11B8DD|nr:DUF2971 domain-containing protein [Roseivirga sp.]MBO6495308.1 DUF2971 domain-containing protein [Roseivirga sp.]
MTEVLYKYRGLDNFKNFVDIILKNRLYAAQYKDLNDPMEGQYYYHRGELNKTIRDKILEEKGTLRILSLSRVNNNQLMWSHYADGHKGVAIGVRIDEIEYDVQPIEYDGIVTIRNSDYNGQTAREILRHKLEVWSYEEEVRVFQRNQLFIDVKIEEIILGQRVSNQNVGLIRELLEKINPEIQIRRAEELFEN